MPQPVIVSAVRTPIGALLGDFSSLAAWELGAVAIKAAVERAGVPGDAVEPVRAEIEAIRGRDWPGNVRELKHAVEYACVVARGGHLGPEHLPVGGGSSGAGCSIARHCNGRWQPFRWGWWRAAPCWISTTAKTAAPRWISMW